MPNDIEQAAPVADGGDFAATELPLQGHLDAISETIDSEMIDTSVRLELLEEPTAPRQSPQQPSTNPADNTGQASNPAIITGASIPASVDSLQPTADRFFDIVGTEVPMRLADHIGTKTAEQIREIVAKIKARSGSKMATRCI